MNRQMYAYLTSCESYKNSWCAFEWSLAPTAPEKPPLKRPSTKQTTDLPALSSGAPKLHHMCHERPRRMKTRAVTRPTVGLTHSEDAADDDAADNIDIFFASSARTFSGASADNSIVNGEVEKGWGKLENVFGFGWQTEFLRRLANRMSFICLSVLLLFLLSYIHTYIHTNL